MDLYIYAHQYKKLLKITSINAEAEFQTLAKYMTIRNIHLNEVVVK